MACTIIRNKKTKEIEQVLASNGKESILYKDILKVNPDKESALRSWAQVYTPSFKNWFGDWENQTITPDKIVDLYAPEIYVNKIESKTTIDKEGKIKNKSSKFESSISISHKDGTYSSLEVNDENLKNIIKDNNDIIISTTGKTDNSGLYIFRDAIVPLNYTGGISSSDLEFNAILNNRTLSEELFSNMDNFPKERFKNPIAIDKKGPITIAEIKKYLNLENTFQIILSNKSYYKESTEGSKVVDENGEPLLESLNNYNNTDTNEVFYQLNDEELNADDILNEACN